MKPGDPCPRCRSTEAKTVLMPEGHTHHARLMCGNCDRQLGWLPKPRNSIARPNPAVQALIRRRPRPAPLTGSEDQVKFARSVRASMIAWAESQGRDNLRMLLSCVTDASWFLANRDRRLDDLTWPAVSQVEDPRQTGKCANCGAETFDWDPHCSDECADEHTAYVTQPQGERR